MTTVQMVFKVSLSQTLILVLDIQIKLTMQLIPKLVIILEEILQINLKKASRIKTLFKIPKTIKKSLLLIIISKDLIILFHILV